MNKKNIFLALSIISFLFSLWLGFRGFIASRLYKEFLELNVQLPLYTYLWANFWWVLVIIFLGLAIWLFLKFKKSEV